MKIKVGVLFGGKSVEHEVSIISAVQACYAFDREKYEVVPIYMTRDNRFYTGEALGKIETYRSGVEAMLKSTPGIIQVQMVSEEGRLWLERYPQRRFGSNRITDIDVVFPIVHGTNVEDGALQGYLKTLGVPFVGCDVLASAVGMDKYVMKMLWQAAGLPVLPCLRMDHKRYLADSEAFLVRVEQEIGYPVIVKPINLGSSVGIRKAMNRQELEEALEYAFQFAVRVLVERAVQNLKEINCSVIGDYAEAKASECEEPVSHDRILTYEEKYLSGGGSKQGGAKTSDGEGMASLSRKIPADITPEERERVRRLAVEAFQVLDCCGLSRIDFMMDAATREIWLNEINTIPGSLSFYLWEPVGVPYSQLLSQMIDLALKRERENGEINYSFDTNILSGVKLGGTKGSKL